jgi:hypothetical protein
MRYMWALLVLLVLSPLTAQTAAKNKKAQKARPAMQTIVGCVDEKSASYVLRTDDSLKELAMLESVGFESTNFARFVGHKVSVSGELIASSALPTLRVTSLDNIKTISDICAPASEPPPAK